MHNLWIYDWNKLMCVVSHSQTHSFYWEQNNFEDSSLGGFYFIFLSFILNISSLFSSLHA